MFKKIIFALIIISLLAGCVNAIDSSDWPSVEVGYKSFKIPPRYAENPDKVDDAI